MSLYPLIALTMCALPCNAYAQTAERKEITVQALAPIGFGKFAADAVGTGTVTIDARTGARSTTGNIVLLSGNYGQAEFDVSGQPGEEIVAYLPEEIVMNGTSGGSLTIEQTSMEPSGIIVLDAQGRARLRAGGTLRITPSVHGGEYEAVYPLDVRYVR